MIWITAALAAAVVVLFLVVCDLMAAIWRLQNQMLECERTVNRLEKPQQLRTIDV